jgi:hypothetical protein
MWQLCPRRVHNYQGKAIRPKADCTQGANELHKQRNYNTRAQAWNSTWNSTWNDDDDGGLQCTYSGATCKAAVTHIHGTHTVRPAGGSPAALPTPNMCVPTGTHSQAMGGGERQYPQTSSKQLTGTATSLSMGIVMHELQTG